MSWVTPPTRTTGDFITAAIWNQDLVANSVALRTGGMALGSQAAQDFLYASSATQIGRLAAVGGQYPRFNGTTWEMAASARACQGRLTLTSGTPVTTGDVTAAGTLYFTPTGGDVIEIYDGTRWKTYAFTELSLPLTIIADTLYDVFVYDNAGTRTLEIQPWTGTTNTRAIALTTQDGVPVKAGVTSRRYLGTLRASGTNVGENSFAKRYLWNYYNRVQLPMRVIETADSWTYTLLAYRQANASALNQLDCVIGVADVLVEATVLGLASNSSADISFRVAIGYDSTTAFVPGCLVGRSASNPTVPTSVLAHLLHCPAVGRHVYPWLELSQALGTTTWFGDDTAADIQQSGIHGTVMG